METARCGLFVVAIVFFPDATHAYARRKHVNEQCLIWVLVVVQVWIFLKVDIVVIIVCHEKNKYFCCCDRCSAHGRCVVHVSRELPCHRMVRLWTLLAKLSGKRHDVL